MTTSTHTEEITVMRDGLKLHGRIDAPQGEPKGPVVILMHGFMADLGYEPGSLLQQASDQLVEAGFTSVRFDFNGRGNSDGSFANSDVYNQVEDAIAVLNFVRDRFEPAEISLLGHSQGGVIAGMTAGMYADVVHSWPCLRLRPRSRMTHCADVCWESHSTPITFRGALRSLMASMRSPASTLASPRRFRCMRRLPCSRDPLWRFRASRTR